MTRSLRLQPAGATFHVTSRGAGKLPIYRVDDDRTQFLQILARVAEHRRWRCLSYCLMENHFHLLVQTPQENLARGMQSLKGLHAAAFNRRHDRWGTLYGARYHSTIVKHDRQLATAFAYVALNPVRAGLCTHPAEWPWSAHRALAGLEASPVIDFERALGYFESPAVPGTTAYAQFIEQLLRV